VLTVVPLAGFLGAGKTTTLISAAVALQRSGRRVAAITSDQGLDLVDTQLARGALDEVAEVAGGCFCRRFDELAALVGDLAGSGRADIVLAEVVGNCSDLHGTVLHPLRERFSDRIRVAPLTAVVDPARLAALPAHPNGDSADGADGGGGSGRRGGGEPCPKLCSLFHRQLAEADILALNKTDLLGPERVADLAGGLAASHPGATVLPYSALTGQGLDALLARILPRRRPVARSAAAAAAAQARAAQHLPDALDCDRCSAVGGKLAGMNQAFQVRACGATFDAVTWGGVALRHLSDWCAHNGVLLGHAKITVRTAAGMAKLSVTEAGLIPRADRTAAGPVCLGAATVNVRATCRPAALSAAVHSAVQAADTAAGTSTSAAAHLPFEAECPGRSHASVGSVVPTLGPGLPATAGPASAPSPVAPAAPTLSS
jgi:G3E family GTPase